MTQDLAKEGQLDVFPFSYITPSNLMQETLTQVLYVHLLTKHSEPSQQKDPHGSILLRHAHDGLHGIEAYHEAAEEDTVRRRLDRKLIFAHGDHTGPSQLSIVSRYQNEAGHTYRNK